MQIFFLESICLLYILLFVYAAVSKLLEFENFKIQLGQSPLLSPFASWILFAIPTLEIIIAILLLIHKLRLIGLLASYTLMVLFTAYIYILLKYSSFVPCSCGGVIQKLSWSQHIIFNCFFIVLAGIAIILLPKNNENYSQITKS
ncbi:MauE/DoxX family redox-associated membrane protein [Flavobacterium sp.]|uniref:MauE/DoxX family redox-associated membrane protein n=1 Tax=Flavobacterium sp. TaxID=239 RepID=UPI0039C8B204